MYLHVSISGVLDLVPVASREMSLRNACIPLSRTRVQDRLESVDFLAHPRSPELALFRRVDFDLDGVCLALLVANWRTGLARPQSSMSI